MKQPRDMFYSNYQAGGFEGPNVIYTPPQGYMINNQYQAYGPNVFPGQNQTQNQIQNNGGYIANTYADEYDQRITKLERQIRRIDQRLRKLETDGTIEENITDSNLYMI